MYPLVERCPNCRDWPEWDVWNVTTADLARLAEHVHAVTGDWTQVVTALLGAQNAAWFDR